jgi:hypothetical protein
MLSGSLLRKITRRRNRRPKAWRPAPLTVEQILAWADQHHARTGRWPNPASGRVRAIEGPKWNALDMALRQGSRGLPGGSSLAKLFAERRGHRSKAALPPLAVEQILDWADRWLRDFGRWPVAKSGAVPDAPGETWSTVERALRDGIRSMPGGESLSSLLRRHRGQRSHLHLAILEPQKILAWADQHHARTGSWPTNSSGNILGASREKWRNVDMALRTGSRGLPGNSSLARLLAEHRGHRNHMDLPDLSVEQILAWADRWRCDFGSWPRRNSGAIPYAPGETWTAVEQAISNGRRGLAKGGSLAALLQRHRGKRNHKDRPDLQPQQILVWADEHYVRAGRWPAVRSGPIPGADGDTWVTVDNALRKGLRGLPGGSSLSKLLRS